MRRVPDRNPLNVVHITLDYAPFVRGGPAIVCQLLAEAQAASGMNVHVVAGAFGNTHGLARRSGGVGIHRVDQHVFLHGSKERIHFAALEHAISRHVGAMRRPDIIHAHHWVANAALLARMPDRTAAVVTDHGHHSALATPLLQHGLHTDNVDFQAYVTGKERDLLGLADSVVCVSEALRTELSESYPLLGAGATVIHNPVAENWWAKRPRSERSGLRCIYLGRASREKGLELCLRAFGLVLSKSPLSTLTLVLPFGEYDSVAGTLCSGSERFALAGIRDAVEVHIGASRHQVRSLLEACNVLLHPSYYESAGIAVIEALARGLRVVARDMPSLQELKAVATQSVRLVGNDDPETWAIATLDSLPQPSISGWAAEQAALHARHDSVAFAAKYKACYLTATRSLVPPRDAGADSGAGRANDVRTIIAVTEEEPQAKIGGIGTWIESFVAGIAALPKLCLVLFVCRWDYRSANLRRIGTSTYLVEWPMLKDPREALPILDQLSLGRHSRAVVHLHRHTLVPLAATISAQLEAPMVYTAHSLIKGECGEDPSGDNAWNEQLGVMEAADAVVLPSPGEKVLLRRLSAGRVFRLVKAIPNGRQLAPTAYAARLPRAAPPACSTVTLVYAGRFVPHKGVRELVAAYHGAIEKGASLRLRLIGAGHGDTQYERAVAEAIAIGPGASGVEVMRWTNRVPLQDVGRWSNPVFCAVGWYEPFGYAYLDALEAGLPCFVTRTSGSEFVFGRRYPFAKRDSLVDGLCALPTQWPALELRCRRRRAAIGMYSADRMVHQYLDLFREVRSRAMGMASQRMARTVAV